MPLPADVGDLGRRVMLLVEVHPHQGGAPLQTAQQVRTAAHRPGQLHRRSWDERGRGEVRRIQPRPAYWSDDRVTKRYRVQHDRVYNILQYQSPARQISKALLGKNFSYVNCT